MDARLGPTALRLSQLLFFFIQHFQRCFSDFCANDDPLATKKTKKSYEHCESRRCKCSSCFNCLNILSVFHIYRWADSEND